VLKLLKSPLSRRELYEPPSGDRDGVGARRRASNRLFQDAKSVLMGCTGRHGRGIICFVEGCPGDAGRTKEKTEKIQGPRSGRSPEGEELGREAKERATDEECKRQTIPVWGDIENPNSGASCEEGEVGIQEVWGTPGDS